MKLYIVKRKGANWFGNMLFDCSMTFSDGLKAYYDKCFHRKKDAKKYLDTFDYKEYFEIATLELKEKHTYKYCQSKTEGNKKCATQCDHCAEYYKTLELKK